MGVIIIVSDGLQVAALGPNGNEWIATPNLNRLATEAIVFDQHFADAPEATAVTRVRHAFAGDASAGGDWPDSLRSPNVKIIRLDVLPPWNPPEELLAEQFEDWPFDDEPAPLFDPPAGLIDPCDEELFERIQRTYAAVVRQFDAEIAVHLQRIEPHDCLILTANRGQNLGEHGLVGDERPWLHEELMHLPLIMRLPGGAEGGRRVSALTQPIDIGPTVLELFGLPRPGDWHGRSLLPLCRGTAGSRSYVCAGWQVESTSEFALQTADEKVILRQGDPECPPMYFVKPDDRWEVNNLRQPNLERAEALERTLQEYIAASRMPGPLRAPALLEFIPAEPS